MLNLIQLILNYLKKKTKIFSNLILYTFIYVYYYSQGIWIVIFLLIFLRAFAILDICEVVR